MKTIVETGCSSQLSTPGVITLPCRLLSVVISFFQDTWCPPLFPIEFPDKMIQYSDNVDDNDCVDQE